MRAELRNKRSKGVVYSNYLQSGLTPYKERLEKAKIPYGEFTGEMKKKERDQLIRDYNKGKKRVLLISSAGGEGLDLKGTRVMQVMEPHWNAEKLKQVEGRAIRFGSHKHLPKEEQKVRVESYLATRPRSGLLESLHFKKPGGGVDEYLTMLSRDKENLISQFRGLMEEKK
jgi:superfamily II DNA/RNA helicase